MLTFESYFFQFPLTKSKDVLRTYFLTPTFLMTANWHKIGSCPNSFVTHDVNKLTLQACVQRGVGCNHNPIAGKIFSKSCSFLSETVFTTKISLKFGVFSRFTPCLFKIPEVHTPFFKSLWMGSLFVPFFKTRVKFKGVEGRWQHIY